jgi:antitoxin HigA-1
MSAKVHDPITPGETLLTEFLEPLGISQHRLAQDLHEEELRQVEVLVSPEAA